MLVLIDLLQWVHQYDIPEHIAKNQEQHIRIIVHPDVPDNCTNWKVFDSNEKIVIFLQNEVDFFSKNQSKLQNQYGEKIMNLNSNKLPKGLVTLERIFNLDDEAIGRMNAY